MKKFAKNVVLWLIIAALLVTILSVLKSSSSEPHGLVAYSDFLYQVDKGEVRAVHVAGKLLTATTADGSSLAAFDPGDPLLIQHLLNKDVRVRSIPVDESAPSISTLLISWIPFMIIAGIWIYLGRQARARGSVTLVDIQVRIDYLEMQVRTLAAKSGETSNNASTPSGQGTGTSLPILGDTEAD